MTKYVIDNPSPYIVFLLTRPLRDVTVYSIAALTSPRISTHTPLAGRDQLLDLIFPKIPISTHTPRAGRDGSCRKRRGFRLISTHTPLAGRDCIIFGAALQAEHISTHTPLAGRDESCLYCDLCAAISTHTPLAGRDCGGFLCGGFLCDFYSHAPCGT